MRRRKAYLLIELDSDETESILPPHLRGLLSRPLIEPITTREGPAPVAHWPGFEGTEEERRARRRQARLENAKES